MVGWQNQIGTQVLRRIRSKRNGAVHANPEAAATSPVRRREVNFADQAAVSELKRRHNLSQDSPTNWRRLWQDNPAVEDPGQGPMGWVLEGEEGIVGYIGNIPLRCFYLGTALKVVTAHGLVVRPAYRAHAGGLIAASFRQKDVDLWVSTSANESAGKMYRAFKGQPLPQADFDKVFFWVIDPHGFLSAVRKKLEIDGALAKIGAYVGSWAVRAEQTVRRRYPRGRAICSIRELSPSAINDDFDAFWRKKLAVTTRLIADRSAETLRWHFDIAGDRRNPTVLRCDQNGRMVGYAVVLTDASDGGLKKALIADLLVEDEDSTVPHQLLMAAFEYARRTRHHVLELFGFPSAIRGICAGQNPYAREFPSGSYLFKATNPDLHNSLMAENAWYATPYDGDATLIPQLEIRAAAAAGGAEKA